MVQTIKKYNHKTNTADCSKRNNIQQNTMGDQNKSSSTLKTLVVVSKATGKQTLKAASKKISKQNKGAEIDRSIVNCVKISREKSTQWEKKELTQVQDDLNQDSIIDCQYVLGGSEIKRVMSMDFQRMETDKIYQNIPTCNNIARDPKYN